MFTDISCIHTWFLRAGSCESLVVNAAAESSVRHCSSHSLKSSASSASSGSLRRERAPKSFRLNGWAAGLLWGLSSAFAQAPQPAAGSSAALSVEQLQQRLQQQQQELERQRQQLDALATGLEARQPEPAGAGRLRWSGYADMLYQRYDFYENAQTTRPEKRGRADLRRFVLSPRFDFGKGWSFMGEIEFEHGGTGATIEYEAEEAGEYEAEIEKGGEIVLEQLYLQYEHSPMVNLRFGELVVPLGMVNRWHQPTEYFTIDRSLAESALIPSVWHESGVELYGGWGATRYQLQLVTALDSTGFSGYEFVRGGMQTKLEEKNASAFALVAAVEHSLRPGVLVGAAFYSGNSAPNRPRQNLDGSAQVTLAELHARWETGPLTLRAQVMTGKVANAAAVTQANLNTYNGSELGTSRTPVGSRARAWFIEGGYDLLSLFGRSQGDRLDAFARLEDYDTHAGTDVGITRIPRYARQATTVGLNYKPQPGLVFKGEFSRREHDGAVGNRQDVVGLAAGFEF